MKTRLLFLFILLLIGTVTHAATINWTGTLSSAWGVALNWSTGTVPTSSDAVQIGVTAFIGNQPTISATASCASLTMASATAATLTVNAPLSVGGIITITSSTINSGSGGTITASSVTLTSATFTLNGAINISGQFQIPSPGSTCTLTTNATGNTFSSGIFVHTTSTLNWNGSGTSTCAASTVYSSSTLNIGAGNSINFTGALTINEGTTFGTLFNSGALTFTNCNISTGNPSSFTTGITNYAGASITTNGSSGGISLGNNLELSNFGTITAGTSTTLSVASGGEFLNNSTGTVNMTGSTFSLSGGSASLVNSGTFTAITTSSISTGNPCSITNNSGGNMSLTASTISLTGGTTFNNSGAFNLSSSSSFTGNNPVTVNNNSGAIFTATSSTVTLNGGTTVNNSGTINATSTGIIAGNPVPITNSSTGVINLTTSTLALQGGANINNSGTITAITGSTISFGNPSYINNLTSSSSLTVTASTLNLSGGGYITNSGTITASASSSIGLNGNPTSITNNVGATFSANATSFTMVGGATITNTGGTFTAVSSPFTLSGNPSSITNQNSGSTTGTMSFNACALTFNGTNSLNNYGTLTLNNSSSVNMTSSGTISSINNYGGTIYDGTSNSPCTISLTGSQSKINNTTTSVSGTTYYGTFYESSTSVINLTASLGSISNATSCTFTLLSDKYGSATISAISSSSSGCSGTFNVQRYFRGGSPTFRAYRLVSSPVYASNVSGNNVYSLNYVQGAALLTGSGGVAGGFDKSGNPTLYLYRENYAFSNATFISGNFRGIANIASAPNYTLDTDGGPFNIPVGNGFLFFDRGDRTTNLANKYTPGNSAESITMTATGTMNTGSITVHIWCNASSANLLNTVVAGNSAVLGYNLVGNPYPSSIDWETFQSAGTTTGIYGKNVGSSIYMLDPVSHNYGAYTKGGGGVGTNGASNVIASGQGFFVVAASGVTAQLIFNENAKTTAQDTGANLLMGLPASQTASSQYLRLQLAKDSVDTEDMLIRFNSSAAATFDPTVDAAYVHGFGAVSLASLSSDLVPLAINVTPLPTASKKIGLKIGATSSGVYSFNMKNLVGIPQLYDIWLMDAYKKDSVDMRANPTYAFNIDLTDTTSFGATRFALVLRENIAYAYRLLSFTAAKISQVASKQVQLAWTTENEQNYTHFTVERSTDGGKTYDIIGNVPSSGQGTYSLIDKSPADQNLYRLQSEDINGVITYSYIIPIAYSNQSNSLVQSNISIYPNPAISTITLTIVNPANQADSYNIMITNSSGIMVKQATSAQTSWETGVSDLLPGTYIIKVFDTKTQAELGNTKFVKL